MSTINLEGHKAKKQTKAQFINSAPKRVEAELKRGFIKNMIQGFELSNQMILDYINDGHNVDDVKSFIEKNLSKEGRDGMTNAIIGKMDE